MVHRRDDGIVLPIVLVIVVVLGAVIVAVATYAATTIRYGQVVEESADRLAAANGAMDNALEAIDRKASLCTLTTLANAGYEYDLLDPGAAISTINGVNPTVRCQSLGGDLTGVEEFALVITGDQGTGSRVGPMLETNVSTATAFTKTIDGPVYIGRPPTSSNVDLNTPLVVQNGDMWYSAAACTGTAPTVPNLAFAPDGYGRRCIPEPSWSVLFAGARPSEAAIGGLPEVTGAALDPDPDGAGCKVFNPGRYTSQPVLGDYNYFRSGNYHFDDIGELEVGNAYLLFGWPGPSGPGIPGMGNDTIEANKCVGAWESDADRGGATVFVGGDSRFTIEQRGSLEIAGRDQGGRIVSLHALEATGVPSTVHGDAGGSLRLVDVDPGNRKQVAFRGLVWAPFASFELRNVANDAVAVFSGGAVVGEMLIGASNGTNLLFTSSGKPASSRLAITATAASANGGTTQVRSIITYRDGDYALESRRVMCTTPDDPDPTAC